MAQSLVAALRQREPASDIQLLAPSWSAALGERMPGVSATHVLTTTRRKFEFRRRFAFGLRIRREDFDLAIVLPNSLKSAIVPFVARIPRRRGYVGEFRYGLLNEARPLDKDAFPRTIDRFVALADEPADRPRPIPSPVLRHSNHAALQLAEKLGLEIDGSPIVAICPGAEFGASKQWPTQYFARLVSLLSARGLATWIFGSPNDKAVADDIVRMASSTENGRPPVNLCGRTSLPEAIDLMGLTAGVVSNDSGLMHIAAAIGRPVVAIYGSTTPAHTPPLAISFRILERDLPCRPCFKRVCPLGHGNCLAMIRPEEVSDALVEILITQRPALSQTGAKPQG